MGSYEWCNGCFYLLYISVCGLPHVVILNNTCQRLPRQLQKTAETKQSLFQFNGHQWDGSRLINDRSQEVNTLTFDVCGLLFFCRELQHQHFHGAWKCCDHPKKIVFHKQTLCHQLCVSTKVLHKCFWLNKRSTKNTKQ